MIYIENKGENNPNIIDAEGIEIESTPDYGNEGDEVKMNSEEGWTKMPSPENDDNTKKEDFINKINEIEEKGQKLRDEEDLDDELDKNEEGDFKPSMNKERTKNNRFFKKHRRFKRKKGIKVTKEEELDEELRNDKKWEIRKNRAVRAAVETLLIMAFIAVWNKDDIMEHFNKDNKKPNTNNEDNLTEESNYEQALADNGATLGEEDEQIQEMQEDNQYIEGAYDEVIGGKVLAFTDPSDDDQVYARAGYIYTYLQASNVMDVTVEELCDQIKFINGTYNAATDDEAYDMLNECLETFAAYATATAQSANYAGEVVDDNGVIIALGLDAFLTDNCDHREFMDEVRDAFINVLSASTMEEKKDTSKIMLKLEADLMLGQKETPNGTQLYFHSLTSSEAFITGLMFQNANATIHSALGDNIEVTYTDNIGQEVRVKYETLNEYYNPQCNGTYDTENAWAIVSTDLVETAIAKGLNLTFNQ